MGWGGGEWSGVEWGGVWWSGVGVEWRVIGWCVCVNTFINHKEFNVLINVLQCVNE